MPPRTVIDISLLEVATSAGSVELEQVKDFTIRTTDPGAEAVKTMRRRRRAIGIKRGVPEFEVSLEVQPVAGNEVDWFGLQRSGEYFTMYYEENDGGERYRIEDCRVTEFERTRNAEGEATDSVTMLALDHYLED